MRKLGNGQSVVFCLPEEVKSKILAMRGKENNYPLGTSDVVLWAISETWIDTRRSIPLWAVQGTRFEGQSRWWQAYCQEGWIDLTPGQAKEFLEPERQTLEQRYRPGNQARPTFDNVSEEHQHPNLKMIWERCRKFQGLDILSSLQEEQERQLAPEIESEAQMQRPPSATPEPHHIHPHIASFITNGILETSSSAFEAAFHTLRNTLAADFLDVSEFPSSLLASKDFSTTIQLRCGSDFNYNSFQRPVRWILVSRNRDMMIISPYEANHFLPVIRKSCAVSLHLYAPRQRLQLPSLDRLSLYTVPEDIKKDEPADIHRIQLNLFSGQLFLESYSEYQNLCEFLGVASVKTPVDLIVAADGFIKPGCDGNKSVFSHSPLKFLEVLMSQIRKDSQRIERTHIGKIVTGRLLFPEDFQQSILGSIELELQKVHLGP